MKITFLTQVYKIKSLKNKKITLIFNKNMQCKKFKVKFKIKSKNN